MEDIDIFSKVIIVILGLTLIPVLYLLGCGGKSLVNKYKNNDTD